MANYNSSDSKILNFLGPANAGLTNEEALDVMLYDFLTAIDSLPTNLPIENITSIINGVVVQLQESKIVDGFTIQRVESFLQEKLAAHIDTGIDLAEV